MLLLFISPCPFQLNLLSEISLNIFVGIGLCQDHTELLEAAGFADITECGVLGKGKKELGGNGLWLPGSYSGPDYFFRHTHTHTSEDSIS